MPKVGKVNLRYKEKYGTEHDIWYTQKKGFEIRDLPSELLTMTDFWPSGYEKESDLIKYAQQACHKYRELIKSRKRVILYKCEASTHLTMNRESKGHYSGTLPGVSKKIGNFRSGSFDAPLATIGIEFKVCDCVDDGATKEYFEVDMETNSISDFKLRSENEFQKMDFTEDRYQFFLGVVEAMKKMVKDLSKFFGQEPEKAALFIENNQRLLSSGSDK